MKIRMSDYDHENERHAEISVSAGKLTVLVARSIETNADYLGDDDEVPEDWEDFHTLRFSSSDVMKTFVTDLSGQLIQDCFRMWGTDGHERETEQAKQEIAAQLARIDDSTLEGVDGAVELQALEQWVKTLCDYPR